MFVITLLTPDEGPSLETSIFSCIVSGSERTFTFRVLLNTLGTLRFIGRQRDGKGKKTLYDMCL